MKDLYFLICDDEKRLDNLYERDNLMKNIVDETKKNINKKLYIIYIIMVYL